MDAITPSAWLEHDYNRYYTIRKNHVILDMGAAYGEYALANYWQIIENNAFILMLEPSLDGVVRIAQWMEKFKFKNGALLSCGVWNKNTQLRINRYSSESCYGNKLNPLDPGFTEFNRTIVLDLQTIVSMVGNCIDFVKADIEGSELTVFNDISSVLKVKNFAIAAYHPVDGARTYTKLKSMFKKMGYHVRVEDNNDGNELLYASDLKFKTLL